MAAFAVTSYNIRHAVLDDGVNAWSNRRGAVLDLIESLGPDVVGLQESTGDQHEEVEAGLPGYEWAGVADDPGSGEHNPIGVGDRFALEDAESTWLSESGDPGSVGWDASFARVASRVTLRDGREDRRLAVFNTHFDHEGPTARRESAVLLRERVDALDCEAVVLGDFNSRPGGPAYGVLAGDGYDRPLADARRRAGTVAAPGTTVTDFESLDPDRHLDHAFVTEGLAVDAYRVVDRTVDGRYPSDHLPVVVDLRFA